MIISSRTPEGQPFRCLVCGKESKFGHADNGEDDPCVECKVKDCLARKNDHSSWILAHLNSFFFYGYLFSLYGLFVSLVCTLIFFGPTYPIIIFGVLLILVKTAIAVMVRLFPDFYRKTEP